MIWVDQTHLFLQFFSYNQGGVASGMRHLETNSYDIRRLLHVKGQRYLTANEVRTRKTMFTFLIQYWSSIKAQQIWLFLLHIHRIFFIHHNFSRFLHNWVLEIEFGVKWFRFLYSGGDRNQGSPWLQHRYRNFIYYPKPPVNLHVSSDFYGMLMGK